MPRRQSSRTGISVSKSLTSINLENNQIGAEGGKALAEGIAVSKSLTSIDLCGNEIGPEGATALGPAIAVSKSLTSIDVGFNSITGDGAQQLATVVLDKLNLEIFCSIPLKELRADSLSELNLNQKGVGVPGALILAHFISVSKSLTEINLLNNDLGPEGAKALGPAISVSKSLTLIDLRGNNSARWRRAIAQGFLSTSP